MTEKCYNEYMTVGKAIAKRIDEYLYVNDITLYKLAKDACLPISTLTNLYSEHTKSPTLTVIFKLCEALNVTIEEFFNSPLFSHDNLELD